MIRISLETGPVTRPLPGFPGVSLTVRRLTSPDFNRCQNAVLSLLRDQTALDIILTRHGLVESAQDLKRAKTDLAFQAGYATWLTAVECALYGIVDWEGIETAPGIKAPLVGKKLALAAGIAEPGDEEALAARVAMETLMLDQAFETAATNLLTQASRLLAQEGNGSGSSGNGSAAAAPKTTGGPRGARTAKRPAKRAPKAAATA